MAARYVIGIDLGTTNSVVAYAPLDASELTPGSPDAETNAGAGQVQVELLSLPQLVSPAVIESRQSLPSFLYLAAEHEQGSLDVPWASERDFAVGWYARSQAAEMPDRTVAAAKSWLCHSKVDRHRPILPWGAGKEVPKVSPVEATRRYLEHLQAAWEQAIPDAPLAEQTVVLTVPASFDASARELTREAAFEAGYPDTLVLLEEPQAAVYSWLVARGDDWRKELALGERLLVCDVGGGTSDLTLVDVAEEDGELVLQRVAVGNHLLVGGDNMDLALAHFVAERFGEKGHQLDPWQSVSLWHSCRAAKESLLATDGPETHPISILGRGKKLIGGTITVDVEREQVQSLLAEGFFPQCDVADKPARQRASGFQQIGLPFEADAAITRHLAAFLSAHGDKSGDAKNPTHVLFNGGVFKADALRQRLLDTMGHWYGDEAAPVAVTQTQLDLDHAVARGAAYYGWAKQHGGVRIRGGTARAYYVGVETAGLAIPGAPRPLEALCVVPMGMEEGTEARVESEEIGLVVGQPAHFRFFSSSIRRDDQPGDRVARWEEGELEETDSLETTLQADESLEDEYIPVQFESQVTELGVFQLWCVNQQSGQRWKLEFSVRDDAE